MSRRSGRKRGKGNRRDHVGFLHEAEIKLKDFADNPSSKLPSRVSKKTNKITYDKVKLSSIKQENEPQMMQSKLVMEVTMATKEAGPESQEKEEEELAWDEKDWGEGEFDSGYSHHNDYEEDEEEEEDDQIRRMKTGKKKSKKKGGPRTDGLVYPPDLWFILGAYIQPEEVATFACLCRDAYHVTRTATFWRGLYHRNFDPSVDLPTPLQPKSIKQNVGLRATVIQALYLMYEPFRLAISMPCPVGEGKSSPEAVTDSICLYTWARGKLGAHFTHFLKMRRDSASLPKSLRMSNPGVCSNTSEGECILKVHCEHFQDVPSALIMGLQLVRTSVSVSANMRQHRVKLVFGRTNCRGHPVKSSLVTVSLDPVLKVEVLHWWHPQFRGSLQQSIDRAVAENAANAREHNMWDGL